VADFSSSFSQRNDRERARAAYRLALFCVQQLVRDHGAGAASCLLRDLGGGTPVEAAVRAETGLALPELEAQWRSTLRRALPRRR
jgi:hypothetical protein